jgi:hypothetical protein
MHEIHFLQTYIFLLKTVAILGNHLASTNFNIFCSEAPSPDEIESYVILQECLEMRKRYVFKEAVAPWEKEVISDPTTPKPNLEPFFFTPEGKSDVSYFYISHLMKVGYPHFIFPVIKRVLFLWCHSIIFKCKMELFMYIQIKTVSNE